MKSYRRKDNLRIRKLEESGHRIGINTINAIEGRWPMISEMAIPLKAYLEKIESFKYELARNWCLCKWCQTYDPTNVNFNHWKEELSNFMDQLSAPTLKNNVSKKKHLERYLIEWYELEDKAMVLSLINRKFNKEHIMDQSQREYVAQAFANSIRGLIDAIASGVVACDEYVQATFAI